MLTKTNTFKIALLIDGDNAQASLIDEIISEVSKYGKATIRRIYGDWTTPNMNSWKPVVNQLSISPIQKFSYTTGKNSTDSSLIIDAMDILHHKTVDGFCIVSSDSDYTGLAKRIREEGMFVMGIGKRITPIAFINSCEIFTFTENLQELDDKSTKPAIIKSGESKDAQGEKVKGRSNTRKTEQNGKDSFPKVNIKLIDKAFDIATNEEEEEEIHIAQIGSALRKLDPSFDPRTHGYKNLTHLFQKLDKYQLIKNMINGVNHPLVRLK